jgi:Family of unknown function (DUF5684)
MTSIWVSFFRVARIFQNGGGDNGAGGAAAGAATGFIELILAVVIIASLWKIFSKAGKPGWAAIIPLYNYWVLLQIVGRPGWWILLFFVPFVNLIIGIIVLNDLSKSFGKGVGFTIGLFFLSFIFLPILGFGDAKYMGPAAAPKAAMM